MNAASQIRLRLREKLEFARQMLLQLVQIVRPLIRQFTLQDPPHPLIRIQLGHVGGKVLQMQPGYILAQLSHRTTPMRVAVIQ